MKYYDIIGFRTVNKQAIYNPKSVVLNYNHSRSPLSYKNAKDKNKIIGKDRWGLHYRPFKIFELCFFLECNKVNNHVYFFWVNMITIK